MPSPEPPAGTPAVGVLQPLKAAEPKAPKPRSAARRVKASLGITISPRKTSPGSGQPYWRGIRPGLSYIAWLTAPTTAQSRLLSRAAFGWNRRREERSDAAIQWAVGRLAVPRFPPGTKSRGSQWRAGLTQVQFTLSALSPLAPPGRLGHRG